jgi:actin-related protein
MNAGFNDDLVIDFGTKYIKFGCSNESKPRGFIESNSLKNLHEIITQKCCILNKKSIIFIENPGLSIKQKSEIIKEFAGFKIRWIPSSISSLISVGSSVGLVVDIGYQCTTAVPVR